jgi:TonB family protein
MRLHFDGETKRAQWSALMALLILATPVANLRMGAQAPDTDRWSQVYAANDLDLEGNKPFHLQMTFQLYNMAGAAAETGTIEELWYSPLVHHIVIHSPSFNRDSEVPDAFDEKTARERYLIDELLEFALRPVPKHALQNVSDISESDRNFGKTTLGCLQIKPVALPGIGLNFPTVCTVKDTARVRAVLYSEADKVLVRNSLGTLYGISVALDMQISLMNRQAITGKVTSLTSLAPRAVDPQAALHALTKAPLVSENARIAGGVISGSRTKFVQPSYPFLARQNHMSGSVLLKAVIGKDGSIEHLIPIASADPIFTEAAMDAVKHWTYKPSLLNGEPTEVDTTITVSFSTAG